MSFFMTIYAQRNNFEPIYWCITGMMILFGLFTTITFVVACRRHSVSKNSIINCIFSFPFLWILNAITFITLSCIFTSIIFSVIFLAFKTTSPPSTILSMEFSASFCLKMLFAVLFLANFTICLITKRIISAYIEFTKRFNFFAFGALLCYDLLRHNQFLNNWLCYEPVAARTAVGSLYYREDNHIYKINNKILVK